VANRFHGREKYKYREKKHHLISDKMTYGIKSIKMILIGLVSIRKNQENR
jgi:hypothetical protein